MRCKTFAYLLAIILLVWPSFAVQANVANMADRLKIHGTVSDPSGSPIGFATVKVEGQGVGTLTDINGKYSLTCSSGDSVVVTYSMIGYITRKRVLRSPHDSVTLKVVLSPSDVTLGTALVKGHKVSGDMVQTIKPKDNGLAPSASGNGVEDLVSTLAGVSRHDEMSSKYNVRGGSFEENLVYINSHEVYRPRLVSSSSQEGLSIINSDMVEKIDFSAGGFPAKYGDKMSSVLDITYRRPVRPEFRLSASLLGGSATIGAGNGKLSMLSSVRYKTTRYLLSSLETSGEYRPNFLDWQSYLVWTPNDKWSADLLVDVSNNHYNFRPKDRETRFGTLEDTKEFKVYFDGQERDRFLSQYAAAKIARRLSKQSSLYLSLLGYHTKEHVTYDIQGQYWLNELGASESLGVGTYREHARDYLSSTTLGASLGYKGQFASHTVLSAVSIYQEHTSEHSSEWEMRDSSGYSIPAIPDHLELLYSLYAGESMKSKRIEAYAQDVWRINSDIGYFTLNYGLRYRYLDWNKESIVSPRASLGFIPKNNDSWMFRIAAGVYYQTPSYKEIRDTVTTASSTIVRLSRDIKSPRSIQVVAGADYSFKMASRPFKFSVEAYYKALHNLIPYNVSGVRTVYYGYNAANGYAAGIDTRLYGEFVPGTDSWITFSLMKTQQKIKGKSLPLPTDQRYNLSLYFTDYFPGTDRWKLFLRGSLADGLPFGPPHTGMEKMNFRAPAYKRVDIGMNYNLISDNGDRKTKNGEGKAASRGWLRSLRPRAGWLGIDVFNVLGINNVNSYYWVSDITGGQFAVPNYLTGRLVSLRLQLEF